MGAVDNVDGVVTPSIRRRTMLRDMLTPPMNGSLEAVLELHGGVPAGNGSQLRTTRE